MLLDNNTKKVFDLIDMYDNLNNVDKVRLAIYFLENKSFYINFNIKDIIILLKEVLNKLDSNNSKNIVNFAKYKPLLLFSTKYLELTEKEKIIILNTIRMIEICLSKEVVPREIDELLEKDYIVLSKTRFVCPYIKNIAKINNDFIPDFSSNNTSLSKKDIIELLHDFFKNGTTKEMYELFCKIYNENKKNIHFFENSLTNYIGETIYLEYFKKTYIQVFKNFSFEDLITFAHEFGHAVQFNTNFQINYFHELNIYILK